MTQATSISKIAAVVAGLAVAASLSFVAIAPAHAQSNADLQAQISSLLATIQSLQSQLNGSQTTTTSVTFSRDLTLGSTGADVTALQTWLIGKGYAIPAGATGYFGAQTKAALAAYQAAKGISPAVGYFGPLTRASVNAMSSTSTTTTTTTTGGTTTTSTTLSGSEATLSNFQFNGGIGTIHEGDTNVALANAKFDVQNGDVNVQRTDLEFQATNTSLDTHPWKFISSITVWDGSTKLGTVDTSSSNAWNDNLDDAVHSASTADVYKISIAGLSDVVKAGSTNHQLSFTATAQNTLDSTTQQAQTFRVDVPDQGIRAVDAVGIQQYVGGTSNYVTVGFNRADNGKLTVSEDTTDPQTGIIVVNNSNVTQNVPVFAFNLRNTNNGASKIDDILINEVGTGTSTSPLSTFINNANLVVNGQNYSGNIQANGTILFRNVNFNVPGNSSVVGTLKVDFASQSNYSSLSPVLTFSLPASGVTAEGQNSGDIITTGSGNLTGTATGKAQTLALSGIVVVADSVSSVVQTPGSDSTTSYGTYTIKFDVTAVQNDAYIPRSIASTTGTAASTTSAGVLYSIPQGNIPGTTTETISSAADISGNYFRVPTGSTRTFTATVTINPTTSSTVEVDLNAVRFTVDQLSSDFQLFTIDPNNSAFRTNPVFIP